MDFVEKLEIIQLDLESFEKIEEMTNSLVIGKTEIWIPNNVRKIEERLLSKSH